MTDAAAPAARAAAPSRPAHAPRPSSPTPPATAAATVAKPKAEIRGFSFYYGAKQALRNITMPVEDGAVTALIGPSGCGKSTLLRAFNRMHDLTPDTRYEGEIILHPDDVNIVGPG